MINEKLVIGAMLHDIGKVVYRDQQDKNHSEGGYEYLKDTVGLTDPNILNMVRYHHAAALRNASLSADDLSYVVYMADNIASAVDRRSAEEAAGGFDLRMPLEPVFNILNGNHQKMFYSPHKWNIEESINYRGAEKEVFSAEEYAGIIRNITDNLKGIEFTSAFINSLLAVTEANLSYVPSSTAKAEIADISLFDHMKVTAAAASCIFQYLQDLGETDYKKVLLQDGEQFYSKNAFLLASLDVSGIQSFIYTIATKNALRTLRARSFYLEILMEHLCDQLLERLDLTRANLLYNGGGHCYMLLPNTDGVKQSFDAFLAEANQWMIDQFQTSLYIAGGYAACSSDSLKNEPAGSYSDIYRTISAQISKNKLQRYTADQILQMNHDTKDNYTRECRVCRNIGDVDQDGVCPLCRGFERLSKSVLYDQYYAVVDSSPEGMPLPGGWLIPVKRDEVVSRARDGSLQRLYVKNNAYTGKNLSTRLFIGDYTTGDTFEQFASESQGISRIGVLRADVDNLGSAFVSGFNDPDNNNRYVTISRTSTLSRQLSMFFKLHIKKILENPGFTLTGESKSGRKASIVYSGGDDLFIVGAWDDVIELAVDIRNELGKYTENSLTLSGGIGIYQPTYPISVIADEVEEMVELSKAEPGKDSITIFEDQTFSWKRFEAGVIGEKFDTLNRFFKEDTSRGNSFLYHVLELIRNQDEKINFARLIYLLARLEPKEKVLKERYLDFRQKIIQWTLSDGDRKELLTAIQLYVYLNREVEN